MKIINFFKFPKSNLEKSRILYYRIKKMIYSKKTKKSKFTEKNNFIFDNINKDFLDEYLIISAKKNRATVLKEADSICEGIYRSISGDSIKIDQMNWNKDFIFNHTWEIVHYSEYVLKNEKIKTDIKHVWELSRFYHLVILGQAFALTKDDKYARKIIEDVTKWIEQNPLNYSVNWTVSMEVAIRAVNLIQAFSLIRESELISNEFTRVIMNLVYDHGIYIFNNLEKGLNTNNHYLSNLVGLIWISLALTNNEDETINKTTRKWLSFSIEQLDIELEYQIYQDGLSYEDSTAYHGLNTEMILLTVILLEKYKIENIKNIKKQSQKMLDSFYKLLNNFEIPVFGDLDNGKLIICDVKTITNKINFQYLYDVALFYRVYNYEENTINSPVKLRDSGFYRVFNDKFDCIIKCGQIGVNGIGGHAHNDQLSFVLSIYGKNILIDPGTGSYSGDYELRNKLRATSSHNTLLIEGFEQNDISKGLFKMVSKTESKVIDINKDYFKGKHKGYNESLSVIYSREVLLNEDYIEILDKVNKLTKNNTYTQFIMDQDVSVIQIDQRTIQLKKEGILIEVHTSGQQIEIIDQLVSKSYGAVASTNKIMIRLNSDQVRTTFRIIQ